MIRTLTLVDIDGPPPEGGGCRITADFDDQTLLVTAVRYQNTMIDSATFTISLGQRSRVVTIAAGTPLTTILPPFNPGNWTPAVQQTPLGNWGLVNCDIQFGTHRGH